MDKLSQLRNLNRRAESRFTNITFTINCIFLCVSAVWDCPSSVLCGNTSGISNLGEKSLLLEKGQLCPCLSYKEKKDGLWTAVGDCYLTLYSLYLQRTFLFYYKIEVPWLQEVTFPCRCLAISIVPRECSTFSCEMIDPYWEISL